jgi:hypothetical protein
MPQPTKPAGHRVSPSAGKVLSTILRREARLRPEYAGHYPGIQANVWEPAAVLCDRVLARGLLRGSPMGWRDRVLAPEHFEFRGGGQEGPRPRREDR